MLLEAIAGQHQLAGGRRYVVAFSGGLDSTVLLDLARRALPQLPGAALTAVHVNHGLHEQAADCERHCAAVGRRLGVRFESRHADASAAPGQSPEEAARRVRYQALAGELEPGDVLLAAHTLDDQLETVLLQLMRGAGVAGLAGMGACTGFARGWLLRPLLGCARAQLESYARRCGLEWFDDPTNADLRFDRNYLRHVVTPALRARWPAAAVAAARSARHCAAASRILDELAAADLDGAGDAQHRLSVARLRDLTPERRASLMRHWIAGRGLPGPGTAHLERCMRDLMSDRDDSEACVSWPGAEVRRYRDRLYALRPPEEMPADFDAALAPGGERVLPAGLGVLRAQPVTGAGLSRARCAAGFRIRFRAGGERIQPHDQAHTRALRNLFQEAGVVPWMRSRVPLLYVGDRLVAVADLWTARAFRASEGEAGLRVVWDGRPPLY